MSTKNNKTTENPANTSLQVIKKDVVTVQALTAKERIQKAEVFEIVAGKFDFLQEKKKSLEKFMVKNEGLSNCKLVITSSNGSNFDVQNASIISEILGICNNKLNFLISETETEILNFQI